VDPKELEERRATAEQTAESVKQAQPRITLLNQPLRHHEDNGSLTADIAREDRGDGVESEPP
jgi:hypothetical protein